MRILPEADRAHSKVCVRACACVCVLGGDTDLSDLSTPFTSFTLTIKVVQSEKRSK
jgi:hypothetical protein